ncbi:hypothetical protein [uncultured Microbacterium sp.]|uniref:Uncharacterized protein n=1 Tax=uncultured Microbacterium sp. TaxID=191216 RepID=A0A1Y5P0X2_9MICO|nr:hypothetical protein [uncultured Microbacterium sp.]SBS70979.1 hypothetical protein MIPYR_10777 [uncultured Microbacterium sp.]
MDEWHPVLAAVETRAGQWVLVDPDRRAYGTVELVRARSRHVPDAAPERLYKCVRGGEIIAWAQTLRTACMIVHRAYIAAHGPNAAPPGGFYPDLSGGARPRGQK